MPDTDDTDDELTTLPARLAPIRGEMRRRGFRRVSHGLVLPVVEEPDDDAWLRDLHAWRLVLPDGAVFTHITGARLRGWQLPRLPTDVPVFAAVRGGRRPRRLGLVCSRLVHASTVKVRSGLPVDSAAEILLRMARDLGTLDVAICLDSALQCGDLDLADLEQILASGRPGVLRLRAAYRLVNPRSESAGESVLHCFLVCMDVDVEPQSTVRGPDGDFVARADFLIRGTTTLVEYDGAVHRSAEQHRKDLRRERALADAGHDRRGYALDDLLNHPAVVMQELDNALGRDRQQSRLRRWRRLVDNSMYDEAVRSRMLNRWRRQMGVFEWAGTA